jgi:hypothetical protein
MHDRESVRAPDLPERRLLQPHGICVRHWQRVLQRHVFRRAVPVAGTESKLAVDELLSYE